ncbi:MAG: hypothetical protein H7A49_17510 [Akkermansiaceae bacterium]|nr:hypothetical protein [Akkermansiaceae bacterium]MCP5549194.1 hypothetical protein [Akkermansiaceae bacterium]
MSEDETIVCKPTPWFLFRAAVMLVMFGVFAVMFYRDGSTGYRHKNEMFYLHRAFKQAAGEFEKMNADGSLTPEEWKRHAGSREVAQPEDGSVMPAGTPRPMPWPEILHDYEKMKPLQWNILWNEYTGEKGWDSKPVEEPYSARKIGEQWIVFWICLALALGAAFFLLRTLRRSITAGPDTITSQDGRTVAYADLKTLDLRKWDTKGLAFLDYDGPSGKGRLRLDGLTYGGFKKENDEPAEKLMRRIRSKFSGEIIEYAPGASASPSEGAT